MYPASSTRSLIASANNGSIVLLRLLAAHGRIQREGEAVHLVAQRVSDLSDMLSSVGYRDADFPLPCGNGDQLRHGCSRQDPRELPPKSLRVREPSTPDLHIDTLKVKAREFR